MESYLVTAFILVAIGMLMLLFEFFVSTGGYLIVGGCLFFLAAIGVIFYNGTRTEMIVSVVALCIGLPAIGYATFTAWKRFAITRGLNPDEAGGSIVGAMPELAGLDKLKGRYGKTATPMRPSGSVIIDGKRIDAMTEGMMLDANVWVRCVNVKAGRVLVRQVDAPQDLTSFDLDELK
jgi:membrane-bound ClpP family serine protease